MDNGWPKSAYATTKLGLRLIAPLQQQELDKDSTREDIIINAVSLHYKWKTFQANSSKVRGGVNTQSENVQNFFKSKVFTFQGIQKIIQLLAAKYENFGCTFFTD